MKLDQDYRARAGKVMFAALTKEFVAGERVLLRSRELVEALTDLTAIFAGTSAVCRDPEGVREFCAFYAKQLADKIVGFQGHDAASIFDMVLEESDVLQ